jgi:polyphosphate kinase
MEHNYSYFKRDISWLSFNYRVLMEADDDSLPLYERINFIAIYSSNLEEFYKVRVAEHRAVASGGHSDDMTPAEAHELIRQITSEVNIQLEDRIRIYDQKLIPALRRQHIIFYQSRSELEAPHQDYISGFFQEEIFPYLQPVPVCRQCINTFLRDNRLYLAARLRRKDTGALEYFILKLPYSKVPRFIELPSIGENRYLMFMEDIIKANLWRMFPGYDMDCSYCCKISRDADIFVDDADTPERIVEQLKKKVKKRKIGAVCRFVYDRNMPADFLAFLADAFGIHDDELVPGDKHLNLEDLAHLPDPDHSPSQKPASMHLKYLDEKQNIQRYVNHHDLLLHFPYHSFDHFIHFLYEAVHDPACREIMITQYRVAENSEVIHTLMAAAQNGKQVTVFVELKARFDEENNLATAEMMKRAGIRIIFSIPGLKVHAKVALVLRRNAEGKQMRSYAYISTGNFNEKTAKLYADSGLFTSNEAIVNDLHTLFRVLSKEVTEPKFKRLLVARFNLLDELKKNIDYEIAEAKAGREGRIILKMNALQDSAMINELYRASEAGVEIDLIVRGICCLIPGQTYSRHIRVTRIVDMFLEHARVWYFRHGGHEKVYLGSPDWMRRNLYRRIEAVTPILHDDLKQELIQMLRIQLADNQKAGWVDDRLRNVLKRNPDEPPVRAQWAFYEYLKGKNRK